MPMGYGLKGRSTRREGTLNERRNEPEPEPETMSEEPSLGLRLKKKPKFMVGKSKNSKDGDYNLKTVSFRKKNNFNMSSKESNFVAGRVSSSSDNATLKGKLIENGGRRKRIYAGQGQGQCQDSNMETFSRNSVSRTRGRHDSELGKSNASSTHSFSKGVNLRSKRFSRTSENGVKYSQVSDEKRKMKGEKYENGESVWKTDSKNTKDLSKKFDSSKKRFSPASPSDPAKKRLSSKRSMVDNSELLNDQPKKKKRVIKLDPYDLSNKRLDDGIVTDEKTREGSTSSVKKDEISKNAQFRAIQPSKSVLSFVEDNLLGRRRLIEIQRAGYNTDLSAPLDNIPLSKSADRERIEENIFRNKLTFFAAAKVSSSFPPPDLPEIAFAGRSNVGKSSLLNALTRQWGVVRTSDKPGLTQSINFFNLGSKLSLVDLPGYGFAYAKEEVKDAWEELVKEYVSTRVGLKRVCLLIDTKWGMKPRDQELIALMERYQTKYQIVLTKTDTVFPVDVARRAMQIEESCKANKSIVQPLMMVSSKSGAGVRSLRTVLAKIARFVKV